LPRKEVSAVKETPEEAVKVMQTLYKSYSGKEGRKEGRKETL
jgi:hypothetical protein